MIFSKKKIDFLLMMHNPFKITYRRKPCIRLKGIFGDGGADYILQ